MTGPHEPEDQHGGDGEPWYGSGDDEQGEPGPDDAGPAHASGPADPPTEPTVPSPEGPATVREAPAAATPGNRPRWWRSRRVRTGAAATLAGLVLLGGGFGVGYAVADASTPPAAHATAVKGAGNRAAAQAARKRRLAQRRSEQGGPTAGAGAGPGATAVTPTF